MLKSHSSLSDAIQFGVDTESRANQEWADRAQQLEQRVEELEARLENTRNERRLAENKALALEQGVEELREAYSNTPLILEGDNAIEVAQWFAQIIEDAIEESPNDR